MKAAVPIATGFLGGCIGFLIAWLIGRLGIVSGPPAGVLLVVSVLAFAGIAGLLGLLGLLATWRWISKKRAVVILAGVSLLLAGTAIADYLVSYYGPPLTRAEALEHAGVVLQDLSRQHMTGGTLPLLSEQQYDPGTKTWVFTFRNDNCEIDIITDRLQGTEVGGMTKGCDMRSREPVRE